MVLREQSAALNFDSLFQMVAGFHFERDTPGEKCLKNRRVCPFELPAVLNCQQAVAAREDIFKIEGAVRVALVATKEYLIVFGVFWSEQHHDAANGFAIEEGGSFHFA